MPPQKSQNLRIVVYFLENQRTHLIAKGKQSSTMDSSRCLIKMLARPSRGLMDEKMAILVQNAPAGKQLTVHGLHRCEEGHSWEAFGYYVADALGNVDGMPLSSSCKVVHLSHIKIYVFSPTGSLTRLEPGWDLFWGGTNGTAVEP